MSADAKLVSGPVWLLIDGERVECVRRVVHAGQSLRNFTWFQHSGEVSRSDQIAERFARLLLALVDGQILAASEPGRSDDIVYVPRSGFPALDAVDVELLGYVDFEELPWAPKRRRGRKAKAVESVPAGVSSLDEARAKRGER